jgi:hypothetical protein
MAATIRRAKASGWEPYRRNGTTIERIEERLQKLMVIEAKGWAEEDDEKSTAGNRRVTAVGTNEDCLSADRSQLDEPGGRV